MNETISESKSIMLSTKDNPFNPFTHFDEWRQYDITHGHYCCELVAKFSRCSDDLSDKENTDEINYAIERIIEIDPEKKFIKVEEE